eukprot:2481479-Pyramimonas_sp.AAC.1
MFKYSTAIQDIRSVLKHSDKTARRTVLTFVASLSAGRPALTFGCVPVKEGTLQMASSSRLSPK